jgi:hypothetical protein
MKLNLLLTILVVLALIVVAALTLRAVIATHAVIYHGEAAQGATDPCVAESARPGHAQQLGELGAQNPAGGIDPCKRDLNLRAPFGVEYAYMIYHQKLCVPHAGGCGGLTTPGFTA